MNFNLNYEGFEEHFVSKEEKCHGIQYLFRFDNNYGASVIKSPYSYGGKDDLWELVVIKWDGDDYELEYDTEVSYDAEGWRDDENIRDLLKQIKEL